MIFCTQYEEAAPTHNASEPSKGKGKGKGKAKAKAKNKTASTIANKPKRDNTP
jgi:hypothetical protein